MARSAPPLGRWGVSNLAPPVIERIGFGFMRSLERYAETRRRHPDAPLFMGVGNITELTAADTTGVNALLLAVCQELGVQAVRSEEHTSELQSRLHLVCRLLLEKKK